jgi:hypothetical protein
MGSSVEVSVIFLAVINVHDYWQFNGALLAPLSCQF